jgi:nucleotide-binding universal stress UspA family protein
MSDTAQTVDGAEGQAGATILVPLDGSPLGEAGLPFARALLPPDGELALVRVVDNPDAYDTWVTRAAVSLEELDRAFREEAEQELTREAERLGSGVGRVRILVGAGEPAEEIVRLAAEAGAELIAMATRGRGALGRWTHGSVADRVARMATVPVLFVRSGERDQPASGPDPAARPTIRRLLVLLDGSELATHALPIAERYGRRLGVPLVLLRAINPVTALPSTYGTGSFPIGWDLSDQILKEEEAAAADYLGRVAAPLEGGGLTVKRQVRVGSPFTTITGEIDSGDAVVLTSHGRSGLGRWLLGSVAEKLIRESPAPVLLVPAAGRGDAER